MSIYTTKTKKKIILGRKLPCKVHKDQDIFHNTTTTHPPCPTPPQLSDAKYLYILFLLKSET